MRLPESVKGEVGEAVLLESVRVVRVLSNTEVSGQAREEYKGGAGKRGR